MNGLNQRAGLTGKMGAGETGVETLVGATADGATSALGLDDLNRIGFEIDEEVCGRFIENRERHVPGAATFRGRDFTLTKDEGEIFLVHEFARGTFGRVAMDQQPSEDPCADLESTISCATQTLRKMTEPVEELEKAIAALPKELQPPSMVSVARDFRHQLFWAKNTIRLLQNTLDDMRKGIATFPNLPVSEIYNGIETTYAFRLRVAQVKDCMHDDRTKFVERIRTTLMRTIR